MQDMTHTEWEKVLRCLLVALEEVHVGTLPVRGKIPPEFLPKLDSVKSQLCGMVEQWRAQEPHLDMPAQPKLRYKPRMTPALYWAGFIVTLTLVSSMIMALSFLGAHLWNTYLEPITGVTAYSAYFAVLLVVVYYVLDFLYYRKTVKPVGSSRRFGPAIRKSSPQQIATFSMGCSVDSKACDLCSEPHQVRDPSTVVDILETDNEIIKTYYLSVLAKGDKND